MKYYKHPTTGEVFAYDSEEDRVAFGPDELIPMTEVEVQAHIQPAPLTQDQLLAAFTRDIQQRLDTWARTRNYDSILSACTYATSSVPKFAAEGQAAVDLRDQTWAAAYTILDDVLANRRDMPASIADIEDDLPALEWPA